MNAPKIAETIIWIGWPALVLGSLWGVVSAVDFYRKVLASIFGKLVMVTIGGWLLTMYGLGIVATAYLRHDPEAAVPIVLPVFLTWAVCMASIALIVSRWNREAITLNDMYLDLERKVKERVQELEAEREKVQNLNIVLEDRVEKRNLELTEKMRELERTNRELVGRESKMEELRKQIETLRAEASEGGDAEKPPAA
jgi:hypothetical protein